jgi:hypothetical protein
MDSIEENVDDLEIIVYEEKLPKKHKTWMDSASWNKSPKDRSAMELIKPLDHKLFYPYRAIGHIIDHNPFVVFRRQGKNVMKTFLLCSQGNTFLKYEVRSQKTLDS